MALEPVVQSTVDYIVRDVLHIVDEFDNARISREQMAHRIRNSVQDNIELFVDNNLIEIDEEDDDDDDDDYFPEYDLP